jgi:hypothetical protein
MSFIEAIKKWDEHFLKPAVTIVNTLLTTGGKEIGVKPIINIGGTIITETIKNLGEIRRAYQDMCGDTYLNRLQRETIAKINTLLLNSIEKLNEKIVKLVTDFDTQIDYECIRELYFRIQILYALANSQNCLESNMEALGRNFQHLIGIMSIEIKNLSTPYFQNKPKKYLASEKMIRLMSCSLLAIALVPSLNSMLI